MSVREMVKACECGCGLPAPIAKRAQNGFRAGEPQRYILGHTRPPSAKGRRFTQEQIQRLSAAHLGQQAWNKGQTCPQLSGQNNGNWTGGYRTCADCGTQTHSYVAKRCRSCAMILVRHGKKPSLVAVARSAEARRGKPSPTRGTKRPDVSGPRCHLWRGGVTPEHERIRKSVEYKAWRRAVFARDGYTCVLCHVPGLKIQADHIKSFALVPHLRFDVSNGRTLCVPCHKRTPSYLNRWHSEHDANS